MTLTNGPFFLSVFYSTKPSEMWVVVSNFKITMDYSNAVQLDWMTRLPQHPSTSTGSQPSDKMEEQQIPIIINPPPL